MELLACLFALAVCAAAQAQDAWPAKPIRFILPFPPGGGTDVLGRLIADRLAAGLGQPVVIGVPAAAPHIKAGKLRALALISPKRAAALPEVPTIAEAGLPDFEVTTWYGVLAPAATPRPVIAQLNTELVKIMHSPELQERLGAMATEPATGTPEEFGAYIRQEIAKWGDVVRKARLKAD